MNQDPFKRQDQPLKNDMRKNFRNDAEIANELNPDNSLATGELPIVAGLKTKKLVELGEEMLIEKYRKKKKQ